MQYIYRRLVIMNLLLLILFYSLNSYSQVASSTKISNQSPTYISSTLEWKKWIKISPYPWLSQKTWQAHLTDNNLLGLRIPTPSGATRVNVAMNSFAHWLRYLPLYDQSRYVRLYNHQMKARQDVHHAVIDIDVGEKDLQQCADAAIRLRADYLYHRKKWAAIHFNFTTGDNIPWKRWANGERVYVKERRVNGKRRWDIIWKKRNKKSYSYSNFKKYLQKIFTYAGTASLSHELKKRAIKDLKIGDIYLQGGFPGHAIMVVDLADHPQYGRIMLLAQSYMPAQDIHVLKNINNPQLSPWFKVPKSGVLDTPEWTFRAYQIKKFRH
jgi:hypothetical protein